MARHHTRNLHPQKLLLLGNLFQLWEVMTTTADTACEIAKSNMSTTAALIAPGNFMNVDAVNEMRRSGAKATL